MFIQSVSYSKPLRMDIKVWTSILAILMNLGMVITRRPDPYFTASNDQPPFHLSSSYDRISSGGAGYYSDGSEVGSSGTIPEGYKFFYRVVDAPSGNDFVHTENSDGYVVKGSYTALLPDGRREVVEYIADQTGYHPMVVYEGATTGTRYPTVDAEIMVP